MTTTLTADRLAHERGDCAADHPVSSFAVIQGVSMTRQFLYSKGEFCDVCSPIGWHEADRDYRDTDAGTEDTFIVQASTKDAALDGTRRWLANRADEDEPNVPDDLMLEERHYSTWKTYMTLRVS